MKQKNKKWFSLLAVVCLFCIGIGVYSVKNVAAEIVDCDTTQTSELKSQYIIGEKIIVPNEKLLYNGNEVEPTEVLVVMPDGTASNMTECTLDKAGVYKVVYAAQAGSKTLRSEKTFSVAASTYTFETTNSTIEYQTLEMLKNVSSDKIWTEELTGMHLKLAQGDVFTYNRPINLAQTGGEVDFIQLFPWQRNGYMDGWNNIQQVQQIYVRLTDCYNPEVYVDYVLNWQGSMLYYRAGANNQQTIGLCTKSLKSGTIIYMDGMKRRVFTNEWGCNTDAGFYNTRPYGHTLSFDMTTNRAYITDSRNQKHLVNDLDNELIHDPENFFQGFTTGEVYLSIFGENWNNAYADIDIACIDGLTGNALNTQIVEDKEAPELEIEGNLDLYGGIKIAYGEEFTIPTAKAYDFNLVGEVKTAVYLNYGKYGETRCFTKDGKFTPERYSDYTIEYTAKDAYGNVTVKTVTLQCVKSASGKGIDFSVEKVALLNAGQETKLPDYSVSGLNKKPTVRVSYIRYDDGGVAIDSDEISGNTFTPYYKGSYTIVYEYTDGIKSYTYSYDVVCNESNSVADLETPALPKYVLKGYTYTFDEFYVYTFASGKPNAELTSMEICDDNSTEYRTVDYKSVDITATEKIKVRYKYGDWTSSVYEVKVVDIGVNGFIKMEELFQGAVVKSSNTESVSYTTKALGDVTLDFVNVISVSHFNFKYDIPVDYGQFDTLVVTLTDYYDANNVINLTYYRNNDNETVFSVNGKESLLTIPAFEGSVRNAFYEAGTKTIIDTANASVKYPINFTSDKAFLTVTLTNVKAESKINIREVNNQTFSDLSVDVVEPEILLGKTEGGIHELNSVINIYPAELIDVITPIASENLTVTVKGPDGQPVQDVNGVVVQGVSFLSGSYAVRLSDYGKYTITYFYSDKSGNENIVQFFATVQDYEKPNVGLEEKKVTSAKVGEIVTVSKYTATDNKTESDKIVCFVSVITPQEEVIVLTGNAFKPNREGIWTVCYYAYDEAGNHCMVTYEVVVEKA